MPIDKLCSTVRETAEVVSNEATHPSDVAIAFAALDAVVHVDGPGGARKIPFADFHCLPDNAPDQETQLEHGEIITSIEVPASAAARRSHYVKVRDRASYEFALVSAAVGLDMNGRHILEARIALGGVVAKPWRLSASEHALRGLFVGPADVATCFERRFCRGQAATPERLQGRTGQTCRCSCVAD